MSRLVYVCGKHKYGDHETAALAEMSFSENIKPRHSHRHRSIITVTISLQVHRVSRKLRH